MDNNIDDDNSDIFRIDLLSSLFGDNNEQKPTSNDANINHSLCSHPILRDNICTVCNFRNNGEITTIPFDYISPNLTLTRPELNRLKNANSNNLLARKKLHLVVDLDHTLVHTRVNWKLTPHDKKFLSKTRFGLEYNEPDRSGSLYKIAGGWVKLRPHARTFIKEASELFEVWVFTLGCRACGWAAVKELDPDGSGFGYWRVITREDLVGIDKHKKTLDLILGEERMVIIVDDNPRVWEDHARNVINVKPYNFFSYDSPDEENKERNASPPNKSWSQLGGDESEENGELVKLLRTLRSVHDMFYDCYEDEYENRDVREVLLSVLKKDQKSNKKQHCKGKKKKNKKGLN